MTSDKLKPCKICGRLPEYYETRSHCIIECQSPDDGDPKNYHRLFVARSTKSVVVTAWNELYAEQDELPDELKLCIHEKDCTNFGKYDSCRREHTTPICCCHFIHDTGELPGWLKHEIEQLIVNGPGTPRAYGWNSAIRRVLSLRRDTE